jgi:beta-carotene ketolase (CrtW type)
MKRIQEDDIEIPGSSEQSKHGVALAIAIIVAWLASLALGLVLSWSWTIASVAAMVLIIAVRTFLSTGLFIVSHDAIHGIVAPTSRRLNKRLGQVASTLYAFFPYRKLREKHWDHHRRPGTEDDPDFHGDGGDGFWSWYFAFLRRYADWRQFVGFAITYNLLAHVCGVAQFKLWFVWILPALLSSLQLFYFGTYLPHRRQDKPFADEHRARTNRYSTAWSLLTCFHFGYHHQHHRWPMVPWWLLPRVYQQDAEGVPTLRTGDGRTLKPLPGPSGAMD